MPARVLDFRSDTVTQPTPAMRKAMAEAEVGDDVYGEDPTVNRLEQQAAKAMGMESALFVPTGTMGNQVALWVHSARTGTILLEENCHIALYEGGAASLLSNLTLRGLRSAHGVFDAQDAALAFPPDDPHFSPVKIVAIENTHNYAGGRCWSAKETRAIRDLAHTKKAKFHIDGARIFNAATAQKTTAKNLVAGADSVMFCLSKGLGAPVGSLLCGSQEFIHHARHARKTLGGGMRQVGHLAAAGLVALRDGPKRLAEDHDNAKRLAEGLGGLTGCTVHYDAVETNMVMVDITRTGLSSDAFVAKAAKAGVLCLPRDSGPTVRFVTHLNVTREDVDEVVERLGRLRLARGA